MLVFWLDWVTKLLPAIAIIVALLIARMQLRAARRATAITIAKTHYRKMLSLFQENTDILYQGTTPEGFAKLKAEPGPYLRYRMLSTNMSFACQEIFLVIDIEEEEHWGNAIRAFIYLFREFINSSEDLNPFMWSTLHPRFVEFMRKTALEQRHPVTQITTFANSLTKDLGSPTAAPTRGT
jgi:hypothetical protein